MPGVCKGQGEGEVPGYEAGAEPACQRQPCLCPVLPLPKSFLVDSECLTWVQESGTCGKVPGLRPEGGIQRGGINRVVFLSPLSSIGESGSKKDKWFVWEQNTLYVFVRVNDLNLSVCSLDFYLSLFLRTL